MQQIWGAVNLNLCLNLNLNSNSNSNSNLNLYLNLNPLSNECSRSCSRSQGLPEKRHDQKGWWPWPDNFPIPPVGSDSPIRLPDGVHPAQARSRAHALIPCRCRQGQGRTETRFLKGLRFFASQKTWFTNSQARHPLPLPPEPVPDVFCRGLPNPAAIRADQGVRI